MKPMSRQHGWADYMYVPCRLCLLFVWSGFYFLGGGSICGDIQVSLESGYSGVSVPLSTSGFDGEEEDGSLGHLSPRGKAIGGWW